MLTGGNKSVMRVEASILREKDESKGEYGIADVVGGKEGCRLSKYKKLLVHFIAFHSARPSK